MANMTSQARVTDARTVLAGDQADVGGGLSRTPPYRKAAIAERP